MHKKSTGSKICVGIPTFLCYLPILLFFTVLIFPLLTSANANRGIDGIGAAIAFIVFLRYGLVIGILALLKTIMGIIMLAKRSSSKGAITIAAIAAGASILYSGYLIIKAMPSFMQYGSNELGGSICVIAGIIIVFDIIYLLGAFTGNRKPDGTNNTSPNETNAMPGAYNASAYPVQSPQAAPYPVQQPIPSYPAYQASQPQSTPQNRIENLNPAFTAMFGSPIMAQHIPANLTLEQIASLAEQSVQRRENLLESMFHTE